MTEAEKWNGFVDYEAGLRRFGNNQKLFERFLFGFLTDPTYAQLEQAMAQQDCAAAFTTAHTLKGVSGNLSLQPLYEACVPLVETLRNKDFAPAPALFAAVTKEYDAVVALLKRYSA